MVVPVAPSGNRDFGNANTQIAHGSRMLTEIPTVSQTSIAVNC